jgi:hypothetical protein
MGLIELERVRPISIFRSWDRGFESGFPPSENRANLKFCGRSPSFKPVRIRLVNGRQS